MLWRRMNFFCIWNLFDCLVASEGRCRNQKSPTQFPRLMSIHSEQLSSRSNPHLINSNNAVTVNLEEWFIFRIQRKNSSKFNFLHTYDPIEVINECLAHSRLIKSNYSDTINLKEYIYSILVAAASLAFTNNMRSYKVIQLISIRSCIEKAPRG